MFFVDLKKNGENFTIFQLFFVGNLSCLMKRRFLYVCFHIFLSFNLLVFILYGYTTLYIIVKKIKVKLTCTVFLRPFAQSESFDMSASMAFRSFVRSMLLNSLKYSSWLTHSGSISAGSPFTLDLDLVSFRFVLYGWIFHFCLLCVCVYVCVCVVVIYEIAIKTICPFTMFKHYFT